MVKKKNQETNDKEDKKEIEIPPDLAEIETLENLDDEIFIRTLPQIDYRLGGGIRVGQLMEINGEPSIGKTTLACYFAKCAQIQLGFRVFVADTEAKNNKSFYNVMTDLDMSKVLRPKYKKYNQMAGVNVLRLIESLIKTEQKIFYILDSANNLTTNKQHVEGVGNVKGELGGLAKLLGLFTRISGPCSFMNESVVCIINQHRANIRVKPNQPKVSPAGGWSMAHNISTKLHLHKGAENIIKEDEIITGHRVNMTVQKSCTSKPTGYKEETLIRINTPPHGSKDINGNPIKGGIDVVDSIVNCGIDIGMIEIPEKKSSWWVVDNGEPGGKKLQGKNKVIDFFRDNPDQLEKMEREYREMFGV